MQTDISHKALVFCAEGVGHRGNLFCLLFPKSLSTIPNLPKSAAHSANDSSKSITDMSHTLPAGDSSSQPHSCLEKMILIIVMIFLPPVQSILVLQHVLMCCHSSPTILPTPTCSSLVCGSCLLLCRFYHGIVCDCP